jgi:hypothetical protein
MNGSFTALAPSQTYVRNTAKNVSTSASTSVAVSAGLEVEVEAVEVPVYNIVPVYSMMHYHALTDSAYCHEYLSNDHAESNHNDQVPQQAGRSLRQVPSASASALYSSLSPRGGDPSTLSTFSQVWKHLLESKEDLGHVASYRFDLVDVAREVISAAFTAKRNTFTTAYTSGNMTADECTTHGNALLTIIDDYDKLLSSDANFMLGRWIEWARHSLDEIGAGTGAGDGSGRSTADWLESNARNQITLWGPFGEINDYAKKEWGGLVRDYYRGRWELLLKQATATITAGTGWNQSSYCEAMFAQVESPFTNATTPSYPSIPEHELLDIIDDLYKKYTQY